MRRRVEQGRRRKRRVDLNVAAFAHRLTRRRQDVDDVRGVLADVERTTAEGAKTLVRELARIGRACADRGIGLGYHNHAFEFEPLDGTTIWQVLLDELPVEVTLELDVYWATIGGRDPVELIRGLGERLRLLHMKDVSSSPDRGDVTSGDGILPWPDIVAAATDRGVEWYVVEEDNPRDAIAEIARGHDFLLGLAANLPA